MAEVAKEGDVEVTIPGAKEVDAVAAGEEPEDEKEPRERLTDDQLLEKHYPRYFYDKREKYFPVDLNKYTLDKSVVDGCNGVAAPSKDGKHTWLIYMNYYLRDGGVAKLGGKGGHPYDLEIVIVEVHSRNQRVMGIFYGPHSSFEHMWIRNRADLKEIFDDEWRPRVFVSCGKHASYPVPGKVTRLFGLGTDACMNPEARDRPLFILSEHAKHVDLIDGKFQGPKQRIHRDWSKASQTRLGKVRKRRAVPPAKQVSKEINKSVAKLAFWKK